MRFNLKTSIEQFLIDQELKGNTKKTLKYYSSSLGYFSDYIGLDKIISEIKLEDLKRYLLMIKNRPKLQNHPFKPTQNIPIASSSIQTYIRAVKAFLNWANDEGYTPENIAKRFKLPRAVKKVVEILSDEEIEKLMQSMNTNTEMGLRNSCLCALMLDCGLRSSEALMLDYDNIHISQGIIKVLGKGQKERIVPLGLYTKKLLLKYLNGYRPMSEIETKRLLIDNKLKPMSQNAVKQLFLRLRNRTKIDRLHPHILRHTFSTKYLMNGGDIFSLQQILGHTSLEMVRRYSHLASSYVVQNYKQYSPLDRLVSGRYK